MQNLIFTGKREPMAKRAQLTTYIILGMVLLFSLGIASYFASSTSKQTLSIVQDSPARKRGNRRLRLDQRNHPAPPQTPYRTSNRQPLTHHL